MSFFTVPGVTSYRYGYARVSTSDQDLALQTDALHAADGGGRTGCSSTSPPVLSPSGPQLAYLRDDRDRDIGSVTTGGV